MGNHFNHFNQINMDFLNQAKIEDNGDKKMSLVITIDTKNVGEVREMPTVGPQSVRSESDNSNQEPVRRFQNPLSNLNASASVATDPSILFREQRPQQQEQEQQQEHRGGGDRLGPKIPEKYVPKKITLCDKCIGIGILSIIVTLIIGILALLGTGLYYLAKCD